MAVRNPSAEERLECIALINVFMGLYETLKTDGHNQFVIFAAMAGAVTLIADGYNSGREEFIEYISVLFDEAKVYNAVKAAKAALENEDGDYDNPN